MTLAVPVRPSGDCALWRAVVRQAIADATSRPRTPEAEHDRAEARAWFSSPGADFRCVCALADVDPDQVRRVALEAIAAADARAVSAASGAVPKISAAASSALLAPGEDGSAGG